MANSVHIRLDYPQAVNLKRETLLLEKSLLQIINCSRAYNQLRKKEFIIKSKVKKSLEEIEKILFALDQDLPQEDLIEMGLENPKSKLRTQEIFSKTPKIRIEKKKSDIEVQIQEIQDKLARLG